jgi:hypothetical protein
MNKSSQSALKYLGVVRWQNLMTPLRTQVDAGFRRRAAMPQLVWRGRIQVEARRLDGSLPRRVGQRRGLPLAHSASPSEKA